MGDEIYIDKKNRLDSVCNELRNRDWLAVDTEFIREKTYFPKLALVQVASDAEVYCIDPLAVGDLSSLLDLMEAPSVTKVFHAAGQDLETLYHQRGTLPTPVFDTQIAAGLLGFGEQVGYAQTVKRLLGIELDKTSARTDWMKRPLSPSQLCYAADDVRYLRQLYPMILEELESLGRRSWMIDELASLHDPSNFEPDPLTSWTRVKGAGKLNRKQLNVLMHLAAWRERQAMRADLPRRWILSDDALTNVSQQLPSTKNQLAGVRLVSAKIVERHGNALIRIINQALDTPGEAWPTPRVSKKPSNREEATLDLLMAAARIKAREHQLSPGQVTSRSELLQLIRGEADLPVMVGWRKEIAGQTLADVLNGTTTLRCTNGVVALESD